MSRIGKKPIAIAKGVTVEQQERTIKVSGPKGTLSFEHRPEVAVAIEEGQVVVTRDNDSRQSKALHGLTRSLIANMIEGCEKGYQKVLEIVGVGWGAKIQGKEVHLSLGYADTRKVAIPDGITCEVSGAVVKVSGADKQLVGQVAAAIRQHRKPEPYNGKGIRYQGEQILRKEGKAFGK